MSVRTIENRDLLATSWTWSGNMAPGRGGEFSPLDIRRRLDAVQAAGWQGVGFFHTDLHHILSHIGIAALRRLIEDHGIRIVELEFLTDWWQEPGSRRRQVSDGVRSELFDAAAELGATTIKVGAHIFDDQTHGPGVDRQQFAEAFDHLATDAGDRGLRVALEAMPMSNLRTIDEAIDLVREIGNPHGGLAVDTWHVARGGTSPRELAEILPLEYVFIVELADAHRHVAGTLLDDSYDRRQMPGDGDLDTAGFVAAFHDIGWRKHWGVEILSDQLRSLPIEQGVLQVRKKTLATLDAAETVPAFHIPGR